MNDTYQAIVNDAAQASRVLKEITRTINAGENAGNADVLRSLLCTGDVEGESAATLVAFRRATGKCEGARAFLGSMRSGGDREIVSDINSRILGRDRAVVTCMIETGGKRYDNVRLFVRAEPTGQDWKLLAWANEALAD